MPDHHVDPLVGYGFLVSLGGSEPQAVAAGFEEVEGLGASITVVEYRNDNERQSSVRKLPGLRKFDNVTLKRGLIMDLSLWQWFDTDPPTPGTARSPCSTKPAPRSCAFTFGTRGPADGRGRTCTGSRACWRWRRSSSPFGACSSRCSEVATEELGPEIVLDVEVRGGLTFLVMANTGTST